MILDIVITVIGVSLLALLNALYVAGEFGLIGSRQSRLEAMAREGHSGARRVLNTVTDFRRLDRSIASIQVGITFASLALGMYGEHAVAGLLRPLFAGMGIGADVAAHGVASVTAVVVLTLFHVVVAEMVPKTLALQDPARAAMWTERPVRWTGLLMRPFVVLLAAVSRGLLLLLRVRPAEERSAALTLDEIEWVIDESGDMGALERDQALLLANLVDFEDLPLRRVLLPRNQIVGFPDVAGREEVREVLRATSHSRYPVFHEHMDHVVGYIHVKDLMHSLDGDGPFDLRRLCRRLPFIPENATCAHLLQIFRARRCHIALVLDEHGGTAGMVTLADLVGEILGDMQDEFDGDDTDLHQLGTGVAMVSGLMHLEELEESLHLGLKDAQVDTIAGLVLKGLGRMASPGDMVVVGGVRLTVESVDGLAITRVRLDWDGQQVNPEESKDH